jgi:hypothetical protein
MVSFIKNIWYTGLRKRMFSHGTDDKLSWEEIRRWEDQQQEEFDAWCDSDSELTAAIQDFVDKVFIK